MPQPKGLLHHSQGVHPLLLRHLLHATNVAYPLWAEQHITHSAYSCNLRIKGGANFREPPQGEVPRTIPPLTPLNSVGGTATRLTGPVGSAIVYIPPWGIKTATRKDAEEMERTHRTAGWAGRTRPPGRR